MGAAEARKCFFIIISVSNLRPDVKFLLQLFDQTHCLDVNSEDILQKVI